MAAIEVVPHRHIGAKASMTFGNIMPRNRAFGAEAVPQISVGIADAEFSRSSDKVVTMRAAEVVDDFGEVV